MNFLHFGDEGIRGRGAEGSHGFHARYHSRVVAIIDFEWTFASRRVCTIVVGEGSERKPFCPVGLKMINEHAKVLLDLLINLLSLSIGLRVIGS